MCRFFATSPKGLSELLREELLSLGAQNLEMQPSGVLFEGSLEIGYKACLWSRLANRVFMVVLETTLDNQEDLSTQTQSVDWRRHFGSENTFAVSFSGQGVGITHTHYGALKIKDGIVDYFREHGLPRPQVDSKAPDVQVHGHLNRNRLTLSLDMVGYSLHQRGYREGIQVAAPLKENVAAAILIRSRWPEIAAKGGALYDPMCGSGTFLVEAAMIASDSAPGLAKAPQMALTRLFGHDAALWDSLIEQAERREIAGLKSLPQFYGADVSQSAIKIARAAIQKAGYDDVIEVKTMALEQFGGWKPLPYGLVVTNPPYGERLGDISTVKKVYTQLGDILKSQFQGWEASVLTCEESLGKAIGIKAYRSHEFHNGPLTCKLFRFQMDERYFRKPAIERSGELAQEVAEQFPDLADSENAKMVANRIAKNLKKLTKWLRSEEVNAYRVYDADIPEYALAIDVYETEKDGRWVVATEYAPPKTVNPSKARHRLQEALAALPKALSVSPERIVFKVRAQQKGRNQYEKRDEQNRFFSIIENETRLLVNLTDYLDTGVFLDHRLVRKKVAELSAKKSLLNLFCYTGTATVEAVRAGCAQSLSIDMSQTYLQWAQQNLRANDFSGRQHRFVREDVLQWLDAQSQAPDQRFDVIFLDPPSFSTSKRMENTLDIQRDHIRLIEQALTLLTPGGQLIFSTNLRKFKLKTDAFESNYVITDLTQETMPLDFHRNTKIHQVWAFSAKES